MGRNQVIATIITLAVLLLGLLAFSGIGTSGGKGDAGQPSPHALDQSP